MQPGGLAVFCYIVHELDTIRVNGREICLECLLKEDGLTSNFYLACPHT